MRATVARLSHAVTRRAIDDACRGRCTDSGTDVCYSRRVGRFEMRTTDEDDERARRLVARSGMTLSEVTRALWREADREHDPLREYLADHPGEELALSFGSGGSGDSEERGRVTAYLIELADIQMPDWPERQYEAVRSLQDDSDLSPLRKLADDLRAIIENASDAAQRTGSRPWEQRRDINREILESRHRRPDEWVPMADVVAAYQALARAPREQRRKLGRAASARGAGRPKGQAARKRATSSSGDSGDDGPGEPPLITPIPDGRA